MRFGFVHYDMENPWPRPELKAVWDQDVLEFFRRARTLDRHVLLNWGFPVHCERIVRAFIGAGVRLVWFSGDEAAARTVLERRDGPLVLPDFDRQVAAIRAAEYPQRLACDVVVTLDAAGRHRPPEEIVREVFGADLGTGSS